MSCLGKRCRYAIPARTVTKKALCKINCTFSDTAFSTVGNPLAHPEIIRNAKKLRLIDDILTSINDNVKRLNKTLKSRHIARHNRTIIYKHYRKKQLTTVNPETEVYTADAYGSSHQNSKRPWEPGKQPIVQSLSTFPLQTKHMCKHTS